MTRYPTRSQGTKYHNVKTEVDGVIFDSRKEAKRYGELKLLVRAGLIEQIELQPRYDLVVHDEQGKAHKVGFYKGDFRYVEARTGKVIVEDAKGVKTAVYALKRRLMKALYNIDIQEV